EHLKHGEVDLYYYWPKRIPRENAMLTFENTPKIIEFFEYILDAKYPYEKYSQVAVDKYEFGGMENTNSTTLNENLLHDKIASIDFRRDVYVVVHELAHQWFGDLVTCEDWPDIWLHEGFANYCEALYLDKDYIYNPNSTNQLIRNEFFYKVLSSAKDYFDEATKSYQRPIVTNIYKHPDELFDGHTYAKAGLVIHMLRGLINNDNKFRKALKIYLKEFRDKNAETDDIRQIFEKVSGLNLLQFFDQWFHRAGHPEIEIEFTLNESNDLGIKIKQTQNSDPFVFLLEIKLVYSSRTEKIEKIEITEKEQNYTHHIPDGEEISWFSIDPELKILKVMKKITIPNERTNFQLREILKRQLLYGKTIIERIDAAHELSKHYSDDVLDVLHNVVKPDIFYGVAVAAVNTIGSFKDNSDYKKTEAAYRRLKVLLDSGFVSFAHEVRRAIVSNIGEFKIRESIEGLRLILENDNESYYLRSSAATAIAKSSLKSNSEEKLDVIRKLEQLVTTSDSFRQVIAQGAISGLREFYKDSDPNIILRIGAFLLERSGRENNYYIRVSAIGALSKFLRTKNHESNNNVKSLNDEVFTQLINLLDVDLLNNTRRQIKINAASSLVDPDALGTIPDERMYKTIDVLTSAVKYDVDGFVRKAVERSLYVISDYMKKWVDNPPEIELMLRKRRAIKKEEPEVMYHELEQSEKIGYENMLEVIRRSAAELPCH
ncbi:MAG TPA: M1 family aminopeptidase, partial [Nitrososphaeraceae archaeon]|nr:M1 family aminopeptidase [Nitrososphaeraceae archaeon]